MNEARHRRVREVRKGLAALQARLGTEEAMRLLGRASEALDLLGIDRKKGIYLALRGAERLADEPGPTATALADKLGALGEAQRCGDRRGS